MVGLLAYTLPFTQSIFWSDNRLPTDKRAVPTPLLLCEENNNCLGC